jgi:hypothetical protein
MTGRVWTFLPWAGAAALTLFTFALAARIGIAPLFEAGTWITTAIVVVIALQFTEALRRPARIAWLLAMSAVTCTMLLNATLIAVLPNVYHVFTVPVFLAVVALSVALAEVQLTQQPFSGWQRLSVVVLAGNCYVVLLLGLKNMQYQRDASIIDDEPFVLWATLGIWLGAGIVAELMLLGVRRRN